MLPTLRDFLCRVRGDMGHSTNMGTCLFSVNKEHYLPETTKKCSKNIMVPVLVLPQQFIQKRVIVFQKCEVKKMYVQNQHFGNFGYENIIWM